LKPHILLSEGSSLSARQVITALGSAEYKVDVCDPDRFCIGRLSRYVRRFHHCPALGLNPAEYLSYITELIKRHRIDVLLPVHEQAYIFAGLREQLPRSVGLALPAFESLAVVQDKASFSKLLDELGLPQPKTRIVDTETELLEQQEYPFYLKTAFGTASRGVWFVTDQALLRRLASSLVEQGAFSERVLIQEALAGAMERAQAVFDCGRLIAFHSYRQLLPGIGGGDAVKKSVRRDVVFDQLGLIGKHLDWRGPLSVDFIWDDERESPSYIDANPRLVEPMNAKFSGVDLVQPWLSLALGEPVRPQPPGRNEVKSHMAVQALLGSAARDASRAKLLRESCRLLRKSGPYAGSREELTPALTDPLSCVVPIAVMLQLLVAPRRMAKRLSSRAGRSHQLSLKAVRYVRQQRKIQAAA
jgi:hypothetical protein